MRRVIYGEHLTEQSPQSVAGPSVIAGYQPGVDSSADCKQRRLCTALPCYDSGAVSASVFTPLAPHFGLLGRVRHLGLLAPKFLAPTGAGYCLRACARQKFKRDRSGCDWAVTRISTTNS